MKIKTINNGTFEGEYSSITGDTGTYKVVGVYDTVPNPPEQTTVAFAISWRSIRKSGGTQDVYAHSSSAFSGQIQPNGSTLIMPVIHILSSPNKPGDTWKNSLVDKLTFVKQLDKGKNEQPQ